MSLERKWFQVSQAFTADGSITGLVTVADVTGFYVQQIVNISSSSQPIVRLQIKRIEGTGSIYVGPQGSIDERISVALYLVADSAIIYAAEQTKPRIKKEDQDQASWEHEPLNARRVLPIDDQGNAYGIDNPIPVAFSAALPSTVEIASGDGSGDKLKVNGDGSI